MSDSTQRIRADVLLGLHGQAFSEEIGADVSGGDRDALFRFLCASVLLRKPVDVRVAIDAARNLSRRGWATAGDMVQATESDIATALRDAGFERPNEDTAAILAAVAAEVHERYQGDLQRLRDEALERPDRERELLLELKGVGDGVVDVFFREVQSTWDEIMPFADAVALTAAAVLELPDDAAGLSRLVEVEDFPRLVAALARVELTDGYGTVLSESDREGGWGYKKSQ